MSKPLQNPGLDEPTKLDFTDWPHLGEFFTGSGTPGVEYLYLCPEEVPRAQREGWSTIVRMPYFTVNGIDLTAVARGEPIPGVRPGSSVCRVHVSHLATERCKVTPPTDPTVEPTDALNQLIDKTKQTKSDKRPNA